MKNVRIALAIIAATTAAAACSGGGGGGGANQHGFISFGKVDGAAGSFEGIAIFTNKGFDVGLEDLEAMAEDTCRNNPAALELGADVVLLDAGAAITISGPAGSIQMDPLSPNFIVYIGSSNSAGLFVSGGNYTITVPGGDGVDAITTTATATSDLTLNSPDPDAATVNVDKTQDLTVSWTSAGGLDPIYVNLNQDNVDTDEAIVSVVCKFADDGTASIPANFLSNLQASTNPNLDTGISVAKRRFSTVDSSIGEIVLSVESRWDVDLTVQ